MVPTQHDFDLQPTLVFLRPTSVVITDKPGQMSANSEVTLVCVTRGSRPSAQVTWFRENRRYTRGKQTEYTNDTTTVSRLTIVPQPDDDGATMRCRADNAILRAVLEDSFRMSVVYKPVLAMSLGSTLNANDIKEGDDVYFECNIRANPKEYRISWYHNDQQVNQNMSSGVIFSTKSLVLQGVTRRDGGLYTCSAANQIGESTSQAVYLRTIKSPLTLLKKHLNPVFPLADTPVCAQPSPLLIGARLDEPLRVRCTVSADPADVTFSWQFNNSGESFQVSPARYAAKVDNGAERESDAELNSGGMELDSGAEPKSNAERSCGLFLYPRCFPPRFPPRSPATLPRSASRWFLSRSPRHCLAMLRYFDAVACDMKRSQKVSTGGTASELRYRAASERDYGALLCRATNAVGRQKRPCVFQIVPAVGSRHDRDKRPRQETATGDHDRHLTERDYGALLCRTTNAVGRQKRPCVFHIMPAGMC
ncbi:hypothetical protein MSG28_011700 [Choristoneura fumiferana]|uniref:Uncharacterized protein n=1 Tax=Choristoneura fumiferana TaxID=7141 RepID=A0ACC0KM32_CHOFU|nr:hypothetical protein MSG28_011700 [Choristoneura fumiferana]